MSKKPETGVRLYIGGFPKRTTKSELEEFCSRYGKVKGDIDIIPNKQFAFVTFTSKEEATLAMFAIQQEVFKGSRLNVDWAKKRPEEKDSAKNVNTPQSSSKITNPNETTTNKQPVGAATKETSNITSTTGSSSHKTPHQQQIHQQPPPLQPNRYIPGDMIEVVVVKTHSEPEPHHSDPEPVSSENPPEPEPEPAPVTLLPIPNLITKFHYPESNPPLELTIRDTQSQDIKYIFRVKSLSILKNYLLHEANGEVSSSELFHSSSQKNDKNIFYGGIPVVHIYQDLLGKEMLEPRENKDDREEFLGKKNYKYLEIPPSIVPIATRKIPVEEIYHLLVSKSYEYVLLNTSANGPAAPLHPEWKPIPHTYSFRKGNQLVMFYGNSIVESFQFLLNSTNQSYRDLLPIISKYDVCIFNSNKGAFITPEQLK